MKKLYLIEKEGSGAVLNEKFTVSRGETLALALVVLPGASLNAAFDIDITGPDADVDFSGLYVCGEEERVSIKVNLNHLSGGSRSAQTFKGIVGGRAKTDFFGKIVVAQDAQKTEAYQSNHNLLLSDSAEANTKPQLEIYADDVKCSHGATVGRLNEEEQFYMRSRGISLKEARALQMVSFINPVVEKIDDESVREKIFASLKII